MIDLHVHTTASDGRAQATEVLRRAANQGVVGLVFTDHSVVTFEMAAPFARAHGVEMPFPGVEISTFHKGRRHHILAYGPGVSEPAFRSYISFPNGWKNAVATAVRQTLVSQGFELPPIESIRTGSASGGESTPDKAYPSRTAIARCLAPAAGVSVERAYQMVVEVHAALEDGDTGDSDRLARRYLPTLDTLAAAAGVRAVTALAHPAWRCRTSADVDELVEDLRCFRDAGLDGMESRSYHHRAFDDHPALVRARTDLGLLRTGGSDYHANGRSELGSDGVSRDDFEALRAVVDARGPTPTPSRDNGLEDPCKPT